MGKFFGSIRFKNRIFLSFIVTVTIPLIILGAYSYSIYNQVMTNEVNSSVNISMNQLKLRMDATINAIQKYYIESADSDEVEWLLNDSIRNSDYLKLVAAQNKLSCSDYLAEYVTGFTFINRSTKKVLSNRGMFSYDLVNNKESVEALFGLGSEWVKNADEVAIGSLPRETIDTQGVLYYQNLPLTHKDKDSLLIVNIDLEKINKTVLANTSNSQVVILGEKNSIVYSSDEVLADRLMEEISRVREGEFLDLKLDNGTTYRIGVNQSDEVGWKYVVGWNLEAAETGAGSIIKMTAIIVFGCIVVLAMVWIFTNVVYRPIAKLKNYTNDVLKSNAVLDDEDVLVGDLVDTPTDDFKCITGQIDTLVGSNVALKEQLEAQELQLSEFFLSRLISGNLKPEQIDGYIKKLRIRRKKYYVVMTVGLQNESNEEFDEAKQDGLRLEVAEGIPYEVRSLFMLEPSCNAKVITIVLCEDNLKEMENKVVEVYKGLDIYVQMNYNFSIKVGISSPYTDLEQFRKAHYEGIEALKNNEILHNSSESSNFEGVMFYSDINSNDNEVHHYDRIIEKEIKESVDNGDQSKAFELINTFIEDLVTHNVAKVERQFFLQHFMNEILMVPIEAGIALDEIFKESLSEIFQSMNRIYDSEKLKNFYKYNIVEPIIEYLKVYRTSKSSKIIKDILHLIDEANGDITLAECAEELGYHSTYIWKVMKVERNTTFSEYIGNYKVNKAKELLLNTEMTVNQIASKLNYTNAQNFIRFFSKIEGTTPGKYRDTHRFV